MVLRISVATPRSPNRTFLLARRWRFDLGERQGQALVLAVAQPLSHPTVTVFRVRVSYPISLQEEAKEQKCRPAVNHS